MQAPALPEQSQPQSSPLAIASLICGLCGFLTGPLTGIPAIITGHLALGRIKRSGGTLQGDGMAITGLILGYFTTFILVIVGVLAAAGFAAGNAAIQKARRITALSMAKSIETASNGFYTDYGYQPIEGTADAVVTSDRDLQFLHALLGTESSVPGALRPRNSLSVRYLIAKTATGRKGGLVYNAGSSTLVGLFDPWGNPYHVAFDLDTDEMLTFPGTSGVPVTLKGKRVAVWSDGADGKSGTADDIQTW